jgi:hypothetical protein
MVVLLDMKMDDMVGEVVLVLFLYFISKYLHK